MKCYCRWQRCGDPAPPQIMDDAGRFEARVDRSGGPDSCHPWLGRPNAYGYGRIRIEGKARPAQAVAWEIANGPLPLDPVTGNRLEVDHECHNVAVRAGTCEPGICPHRLCCNERHLVPRTRQEHQNVAVTKPLQGTACALAKLTESDVAEILAMLAAGATQTIVAGRFGVSQPVISSIKLGRGWRHVDADGRNPLSSRAIHGSANANAVLGESDIPEIRAAISAGESNYAIAQRYGVSRAAIRFIRIGRTWQHVA